MGLVGLVGRSREAQRRIGDQRCHELPELVQGFGPGTAHRLRRGTVRRPLRKTALPQESLIIGQQFFLAGLGHVGELEFGFLRSGAGFAAFDDIGHARPGRLNHLVEGAVLPGEILAAERRCGIIDQIAELISPEFDIAAMGRDQGRTGICRGLHLDLQKGATAQKTPTHKKKAAGVVLDVGMDANP